MNILPPESGKYLGLGIGLAASFLLCMYLGYLADKRWEKFPFFTLTGSAMGLAAGFYNLYVQLRRHNGKKK